jgi:hypothetical protein
MRFPERTLTPFLLRFIILVFSLASTLCYAGSPYGTLGLRCSPDQIWSGVVFVGQSTTIPVALSNTGSTTITVSAVVPGGSGFGISGLNLPLTLSPGQSVPFSVSFSPQARGRVDATFGFTIASGPTLNLNVHGWGAIPGLLTVNPPSIGFGTVLTGTATQNVTIKSTLGRVIVNQAVVSGSGFSISGPSLPLMLGWGQTATFSVTFTPQSSGAVTGSVTILSNGSGAGLTIPLTGTGGAAAGSLSATAPTLNFGNVQVGSSQTLSETLTNSGGSPVTISQATATGAYGVSGLGLPMTLVAGQSSSFSVKFTPTTGGSAGGNLSIASNASNPNLSVPLSGSGVTPGALTATVPSLSFGSVQVGSSQTLSETMTNSGGSNVTITAASTVIPYSMSGMTLPTTITPGQSANFSVKFTPTTGGSASGNLSIISNASNPTMAVPLSGTGVTPGSLTATASSLTFGTVQVGNSQTLSETLTNSGGSSLTVTQANVTGTGFGVTGLTLPLTLTPGQSFNFGAVFTPTSGGNASGNIAVVSNASNPNVAISMSGSGAVAGQLTISPATLSFGSVVVGQSKSMTTTLNATGSSVVVSSASAGTSEFAVGGPSLPLTIPPGQSASFTVTFTPQASGAASAGASFVSNATNSTMQVSLTGSGTPPPAHSVNLSWNPSTSGAVGYNVYRGNTSGGPYTEINPMLDPSTSYTDSTVLGGQTYYYVSTAVDASGVESGFSNQVKATIPAP